MTMALYFAAVYVPCIATQTLQMHVTEVFATLATHRPLFYLLGTIAEKLLEVKLRCF